MATEIKPSRFIGSAAYWADSSGRRNTLQKEVAMINRKRRSDRSGRAPLLSPGRPPVAGRDEQRRFWASEHASEGAIAAGMASEARADLHAVQLHQTGNPLSRPSQHGQLEIPKASTPWGSLQYAVTLPAWTGYC